MFIKLSLFFGFIVLAMSAPVEQPASEEPKLLLEPVNLETEWADWKEKHGKKYADEIEEGKRFTIFKDNVQRITEHNKKYQAGEVTWSQGLNQFTDLTQEEFSKTYLGGYKPNAAGLSGVQ